MNKIDNVKKIYGREFNVVEEIREVTQCQAFSRDELLNEYIHLGKEYEKLLKNTIKLTRVGDVTQRKSETQRYILKEESAELKEIAALKSRFFANISHEFRTPLTLIIGPLEQMLSQCRSNDEEKKLKLVLRNSQRLLFLINQMLELSKFESGKMKLKASRQNIIPFLLGIVSSFELLANQKQVNLTVAAEKNNLFLYYEPEKMEQVICNLLMNALKFTPPGGKIDVQVREFPPQTVEISVCDTGPGIPPEHIASIFDLFHQSGSTNDNHNRGFGIGLALVKEYVALHHGEIIVKSKANKGTEFTMHFPQGKEHLEDSEIVVVPGSDLNTTDYENISTHYASLLETDTGTEIERPAMEALNVNRIETGNGKKNVVLIIEDSADMRQYIRNALEPQYQLEEAVNGREGIAAAKEIIPDVIISDVIMPEVDGCELCRDLKNDIKTSHIPIILLTAKAAEESIIQGLETGADDYIIKPFNTKILCARLKNLIQQRLHLQQTLNREMTLPSPDIPLSPIDKEFLNELYTVIKTNLSDPEFNVEQLSKKLYMSRTTLYRKILALSGESPTDFIRSCRLKRGAELLENNFGSVIDIAFEVGFCNSSYFAKCFKEKYKLLPSEYQEKIHNRAAE